MDMVFKKLPQYNSTKLAILLILIVLTALYTLPWIVKNSLEKEYSGIDLHGYWYAGHFVRQGVNSYAAILNDPNPNYWDPRVPGSGDPNWPAGAENSIQLPVYYLDGYVARNHPIAQAIIVVPAVTAPLNLLIGLLSWFSWPVARLIWLALNLIFAAVIPWLAVRLVDRYLILSLVDQLIFAFVFYNFYGLRQSIVVGQQTLICLLLLILALRQKDQWVISGVLLGFGISKYSVGLPIFIYFLLQKRFREALVALIIQGAAILLLAPLKLGSVSNTVTAYFKIIDVNYSQNGVHLLARFPEGQMNIVVFIVILFITALLIARPFYHKRTSLEEHVISLNGLNLITLAVFLVTYHRIHDMPFMIFFLLAATTIFIERLNFMINRDQAITLVLTTIAIIFLLLFPTLPIKVLDKVQGLSELWNSVEVSSTLALILMFILSVWYQLKLPFKSEILTEGRV